MRDLVPPVVCVWQWGIALTIAVGLLGACPALTGTYIPSAQRHMRQSFVSAGAVHIDNWLVGWKLTIALPVIEVLV